MDANAPRRDRSGRRTAAVGVAVVGLVAVVAIASRGSPPNERVGAHRPSEGLVDAALSLFLVGLGLAAVLAAVLLSFFGRYTPGDDVRKRRGPLRSVVSFVVAMILLAVVVRALAGSRGPRLRPLVPEGGGQGAAGPNGEGGRYEPQFVLWPVLVVGALVLLAIVAWWLAARGRRSAREPLAATPHEALADVLAATLDDLRAERDPRRAVIAAYAQMERALAASGLPRGPAEAPEEYLSRVLEELELSSRAAARLTALFAWARFSGHDVRPEMKDEAIETLEQVRAELAAVDAARRAEQAGVAA
ncbi:MAG TPA: DUF4129 domain-containing protein [Gaiella sp.]|jgi:hypothetical protein|nr:DUF4129 domain-containing protein [Gaiella sp.]